MEPLVSKNKTCKCVGILTSGGDCPGLNAAIRAVARSAAQQGMTVIGIRDGFRGLVERRAAILHPADVSGILTLGGTVLGTSRDKPNKMPMGQAGKLDMTAAALANYETLHLDCLVCLGGGGTQKNALHLAREGSINVVTLPKTIDNDVAGTDITFGFYTALLTATEAIDRLHSTAESHHRVMVVEIMGHRAGWLTLAAGVSGGADVILIPEIPYDAEAVAASLKGRVRSGKLFSIVAVAEGAISREDDQRRRADDERKAAGKKGRHNDKGKTKDKEGREHKDKDKQKHKDRDDPALAVGRRCSDHDLVPATAGQRVAKQIEALTGLETRVTVLSHLQRGGTPSPADRMLASQLGNRAVELILKGKSGFMVGVRGEEYVPVPLEEVAGKLKLVPLDHLLVRTARNVGTFLGE